MGIAQAAKMRVTLLLPLLMGVVAWSMRMLWTDISANMNYDKHLTFNDSHCRLLQLPTPVEDLSAFDHQSAFAGGGDMWNTLTLGSASALDGSLWLVNASSGTTKQLQITKRPSHKLIFHGIYYSPATAKLYAVNHDEQAGESVEIFQVHLVEGLPDAVEHLVTVRSPLFGINTLNDVVEGVDGEFYVSEWQPFPYPAGGAQSSTKSVREKLGRLGTTLVLLLKIPTTRVFRCTVQGGCKVASEQRFIGANGLAISADKQTVFVSDAPDRTVHVMTRAADGQLHTHSRIATPHAVDNLEMQGERLSTGTIPLFHTTRNVCEDAPELSLARTIGGRQVGCASSPGGLSTISIGGVDGPVHRDVLMHDGALLSQVSSALHFDGKVLLGSPHSTGVLICG